MDFKNRIVGDGTEDPNNLKLNPLNWRTHPDIQEQALEQVLDKVGYVQRVIVNKRTGRLVDGHLRVELARKRKQHEIPVVYVDMSPDEEAFVLATIDPLSALAGQNQSVLDSLLENVDDEHSELLEELGLISDSMDLDGFDLPSGEIEETEALEKITIFVAKSHKRQFLNQLNELAKEYPTWQVNAR
jgi:ParB-like chromosome segregation protein Spo0J